MIKAKNELKNILVISSMLNAQRSARTELLNIFKSMLLNNEDLSPEAIRAKFSPEPDLIIIEGERSLQNAAIVEASYAELYFCDTLNETQIERAVEDFHQRKRNFGV